MYYAFVLKFIIIIIIVKPILNCATHWFNRFDMGQTIQEGQERERERLVPTLIRGRNKTFSSEAVGIGERSTPPPLPSLPVAAWYPHWCSPPLETWETEGSAPTAAAGVVGCQVHCSPWDVMAGLHLPQVRTMPPLFSVST